MWRINRLFTDGFTEVGEKQQPPKGIKGEILYFLQEI